MRNQAPPSAQAGDSWRQQFAALRGLTPYLWPRRRPDLKARVVLALLSLAAAKIVTVYIPIFMKQAVDALSVEDKVLIALPLAAILAYGLARILSLAFGELRDAVFAKVAQRAIRTVALATFRHLHSLSLRFHLDRQTGGLSRAIERGTKGIDFLLSYVLFSVLPTLLEIAMVAGILWWMFDWRFSAVTLIAVAGYVWFTFAITEWRIKLRRAMNESDSEASTKAIDSLLNYETVKYFGNEEHEARRFDAALRVYEKAAVKSETSLAILNVGQTAIISVGVSIMMILAAVEVRGGRMTVGDFVLVNAYLIQLYMPLNWLGTVYREIKQSLIDMEQMFRLLAVPQEVADRPGASPLRLAGAEVRFERVGFAYDPRRRILEEVGFAIPAGRKLAIVGPSGSGKSTIARLLFRFYDATDGRIVIDGQDIREVTQTSLRAAIGIVPQDTVLFNDTIFYNIAYGDPSATRAEVEEVARLARIDQFIRSLPDGYDTRVGERGLKLSGGEKQRVAIARTMLKRPAVLIFDEATSALDTHTEKAIQASLAEVSADRTTLIIAHRLSTVIDADEILVLDQGRVVERGRHAKLLAQNGSYAAMWRRQQEAAERERLVEAQ
ncbi:MAG TPA: ABC transporter ATP-binding protein/permease [Alphaproteobacteria bacterium]|nr:ABC transporter ATP-binding protein/permease [Alphaproteobacteria bacterium]